MEEEIEEISPKNEDCNSNNVIQMLDFSILSKIEETEDIPYNPIILKNPGIPIQISDDCDLNQNFVRLEKLANHRVNIKDQIKTKRKSMDDALDQEILALENEVTKKTERVTNARKRIYKKDEDLSTLFKRLYKVMSVEKAALMSLQHFETNPVERAFLTENRGGTVIVQSASATHSFVLKAGELFEKDRTMDEKELTLERNIEVRVDEDLESEFREITTEKANSLMKNLKMKCKKSLKSLEKQESPLKKLQKENDSRKVENENLEKELKKAIAKCSELKNRRKEEIKSLKLMLKEIEEEMEKEKKVILRAHGVPSMNIYKVLKSL